MTDNDYAWAAGFLDGEGCFSILVDRTSYSAAINCGQVSRVPLDRLQAILGGSVGPINDRYGLHWQWRVYGPNAMAAAQAVLPYLILKQRQAELLIEFQATKTVKRINRRVPDDVWAERERLYHAVKALNARRTPDAERLSEAAPLHGDDATVRSVAN